ncbi:hypothetical protein DFH94DRAFT_806512 [Russula ochroleuca]|uniref:Uncharacterized protein n=1 Tax=Russula ochroleuca TaxID=152965 RepID=A0A9P5MJU7_9AGAM|nr:hypothetical protein DFH94DRAFT_806512 [Russula ochroleuca]
MSYWDLRRLADQYPHRFIAYGSRVIGYFNASDTSHDAARLSRVVQENIVGHEAFGYFSEETQCSLFEKNVHRALRFACFLAQRAVPSIILPPNIFPHESGFKGNTSAPAGAARDQLEEKDEILKPLLESGFAAPLNSSSRGSLNTEAIRIRHKNDVKHADVQDAQTTTKSQSYIFVGRRMPYIPGLYGNTVRWIRYPHRQKFYIPGRCQLQCYWFGALPRVENGVITGTSLLTIDSPI